MFQQKHLARLVGDERGAAMIEFAIVAPLLFLLLFGIIDFGRIFFDLNALTNAARDGARIGAVTADLGGTSLAVVRDTVIARFNRNGVRSSSLTTSNVFVESVGVAPNVRVQVRITDYQLDPIFLGAILKDKLGEVKAEFRHEFQ